MAGPWRGGGFGPKIGGCGLPDPVYKLSASQIDTFVSCERKWGFKYIAKLPAPPNKYAAQGLEVHDALEAFLRDGKPLDTTTDVGKIAQAGLPYLPLPGQCTVEGKFEWRIEGAPFILRGRKDFGVPTQNPPLVGDHKTTADKKWIKTPEELRGDIQATIYLADEAVKLGADLVAGRWIYYIRNPKRPKAYPVDFQMTADELAEGMGKVMDLGAAIVRRHEQRVKPQELGFNLATCDAYGGCPFFEACGLSATERMKAFMNQMSLKEKLAARAATPAAINPPAVAPQAAPVAAVPPPAAAAAAPGPMSIRDKLAARQTQPVAPAPAPAPVVAAAIPAAQASPGLLPVAPEAPAPAVDQFSELALAADTIAQGFAQFSAAVRKLG